MILAVVALFYERKQTKGKVLPFIDDMFLEEERVLKESAKFKQKKKLKLTDSEA